MAAIRALSQTGNLMRVHSRALKENRLRSAFIDFQAFPHEHFETIHSVWNALANTIRTNFHWRGWEPSYRDSEAGYDRNIT